MSAQNQKINQLIQTTRANEQAEREAEEKRRDAACSAAQKVLRTYIDQELGEVLRILDLSIDDFDIRSTKHGWEAHAKWDQRLNGHTFPLEIIVVTGQATISCVVDGKSISDAYLKPGPDAAENILGKFLLYLEQGWEDFKTTRSVRSYDRMRHRIQSAGDIDALLAVAAAVDEEDALSDEARRHLRKEIADKIRNFRNQERAERNSRNARLIYAVEIIELAQAYVQEYAWYELACYDWATAWTRELWAPGELYKVRYVPITADGNTEHCIQELVVVEHPSTIAMGDWNSVVTEVTPHGHVCKRWIGAFLDAKPIRWDKPLITDRYMYHTSIRAGDYYVNIPPADLVPVDTAAVESARPEPPVGWVDWLHDRYDGSGQLDVPATEGTYSKVPMDAFDVARMTPAEFVDSTKINI